MEDFWYGMEMKWKKIASMEYGKIVFHSIPYHAMSTTINTLNAVVKFFSSIKLDTFAKSPDIACDVTF